MFGFSKQFGTSLISFGWHVLNWPNVNHVSSDIIIEALQQYHLQNLIITKEMLHSMLYSCVICMKHSFLILTHPNSFSICFSFSFAKNKWTFSQIIIIICSKYLHLFSIHLHITIYNLLFYYYYSTFNHFNNTTDNLRLGKRWTETIKQEKYAYKCNNKNNNWITIPYIWYSDPESNGLHSNCYLFKYFHE